MRRSGPDLAGAQRSDSGIDMQTSKLKGDEKTYEKWSQIQ